MMKQNFTVVAFALLFALSHECPGEIIEASNSVHRVQVRLLDVLDRPDHFAMVITNITYKTEVVALESQGPWIRLESGGWVHKTGISRRMLADTSLSQEEFSNLVNGVVEFLTVGVDNGWTNRQGTLEQ